MDNDQEKMDSDQEEMDSGQEDKDALVIRVQSWWTIVAAVVMLLVGFLAGYFVRPLLSQEKGSGLAAAPVQAPTSVTGAVPSGDTPQSTAVANPSLPTPTVNMTQVADQRKQLMDFIVGQTKHFIGDPDAPVTIIEFSDFQ